MKITPKTPVATDLLPSRDTSLSAAITRQQRFGEALGRASQTRTDRATQTRSELSRADQSRADQSRADQSRLSPSKQELAEKAASRAADKSADPITDPTETNSTDTDPLSEANPRDSQSDPESDSDDQAQPELLSPADLAFLQPPNPAGPQADPFDDLLTAATADRTSGLGDLDSLTSSAQTRAAAIATGLQSANLQSGGLPSAALQSASLRSTELQATDASDPATLAATLITDPSATRATLQQTPQQQSPQQQAAVESALAAQSQQALTAPASTPHLTAQPAAQPTSATPPATDASASPADPESQLIPSTEGATDGSRPDTDTSDNPDSDSPADQSQNAPFRPQAEPRLGFDPARAWAAVAADILGTLTANDAPSNAPAQLNPIQSASSSQPALDLAGELALAKQDDAPEAQFASANHGRILTAVRGQLLPNGGQIAMRLDPPELGVLQIRLDIKDGVINASFQSDNARAADLLTQGMTRLKQSLESAGISVDRLTVQMSPPSERSSNDRSAGDQSSRDSSASRNSSDGSFAGTPDDPSRRQSQRDRAFDAAWRAINGDPVDLLA